MHFYLSADMVFRQYKQLGAWLCRQYDEEVKYSKKQNIRSSRIPKKKSVVTDFIRRRHNLPGIKESGYCKKLEEKRWEEERQKKCLQKEKQEHMRLMTNGALWI